MSTDARTLAVYDAVAQKAGQRQASDWEIDALGAFLARLPQHGLVLDLGCGPGHLAAHMIKSGYRVDAIDASPGMVALARRHNIPARLARFDQIEGKAIYDGVWANFSLFHAPRSEMPLHLDRLSHALKPGGVIHIGFKVGTGQGRDSRDRFYTYWTVSAMQLSLDAAGILMDDTVRRGKSDNIDSSPDGWALVTGVKRN